MSIKILRLDPGVLGLEEACYQDPCALQLTIRLGQSDMLATWAFRLNQAANTYQRSVLHCSL